MPGLFILSFASMCLAVSGVYVLPERTMVHFVNESYIRNFEANVRRLKRGGMYVVNVECDKLQTWNNNVTVDVIFFEFLNNQYKPTFVRLHYLFCDLINNDVMVGTTLRRAGVVCPHTDHHFKAMNLYIKLEEFSFKWPFEKCKAQVSVTGTSSKEKILIADLYMKIINENVKPK